MCLSNFGHQESLGGKQEFGKPWNIIFWISRKKTQTDKHQKQKTKKKTKNFEEKTKKMTSLPFVHIFRCSSPSIRVISILSCPGRGTGGFFKPFRLKKGGFHFYQRFPFNILIFASLANEHPNWRIDFWRGSTVLPTIGKLCVFVSLSLFGWCQCYLNTFWVWIAFVAFKANKKYVCINWDLSTWMCWERCCQFGLLEFFKYL